MTIKKGLLFSLFFLCQICFGQSNSVVALKEVILPDYNLNKISNSLKVDVFNDSVIANNKASLTDLLRNNSTIYFKENGLGMVSSASFRGTTAQQTAVIWNGININSQFNGQTDFNTISTYDFDEILVRHGGGSAIYGSSAIGGSIHLNSKLDFKNKFDNLVRLQYGSFETTNFHYKTNYTKNKFTAQLGVTRNDSENDYPYLATNLTNNNGAFYNTSYNFSSAFKINKNNSVHFYSYLFDSSREFSGTLVTTSKSRYFDLNTRNLLEWNSKIASVRTKLQFAFLSEKYRYFEDKNTEIYDQAKSETIVAKYQLDYFVFKKLEISTVLDVTNTKGFGESIGQNQRNIFAGIILAKYRLSNQILFESSIRQEITSNYESPLLYSFGSVYKASSWYDIKVNVSKNYRIPTFNDLFYKGSGNLNLKPENSIQAEIGNSFHFKNNLKWNANIYYIKIQDLLRWSPNQNGSWSPNNVAKVTSYGAEIGMDYKFKSGNNNFNLQGNYAYTVSQDDIRKKQLIYVPLHKLTSTLSYNYKKITSYFSYLYNGRVFTTSDNLYQIDNFSISNIGFNYNLSNKNKITVGANVLNLFNENYQNVSQRPMPGRNYNLILILNI